MFNHLKHGRFLDRFFKVLWEGVKLNFLIPPPCFEGLKGFYFYIKYLLIQLCNLFLFLTHFFLSVLSISMTKLNEPLNCYCFNAMNYRLPVLYIRTRSNAQNCLHHTNIKNYNNPLTLPFFWLLLKISWGSPYLKILAKLSVADAPMI